MCDPHGGTVKAPNALLTSSYYNFNTHTIPEFFFTVLLVKDREPIHAFSCALVGWAILRLEITVMKPPKNHCRHPERSAGPRFFGRFASSE
jgi:hypothetical protein